MARLEPKKRTLTEIATAIELGDKEIADIQNTISRKKSEIWTHESNLRKYERERAGNLVEFCMQTGLVKRKAPAPNGIVADGDPLTEDELLELDTKIAEATAPETAPTAEEMPF